MVHPLRALWDKSFTSIAIDLGGATFAPGRLGGGDEQATKKAAAAPPGAPPGAPPRSVRVGPLDCSKASLQVLQLWELGPIVPTLPGLRARRSADLGFGALYSLDSGRVSAVARARARLPSPGPITLDGVLRAAPHPEALLKASAPLGASRTRLGFHLRLPLGWEVWDAVAGGAPLSLRPAFSLRLYSPPGSGLQLSPRGVELGDHSLALGADSALRVAACVDLPRSLPLPPGEPPFRLQARRVGVGFGLGWARLGWVACARGSVAGSGFAVAFVLFLLLESEGLRSLWLPGAQVQKLSIKTRLRYRAGGDAALDDVDRRTGDRPLSVARRGVK